MINRREWIESVIAATAAALVDTSGMPVPANAVDVDSDNDSAYEEAQSIIFDDALIAEALLVGDLIPHVTCQYRSAS